MQRRYFLVGIYCALGASLGCQPKDDAAGVNEANADSGAMSASGLQAVRRGTGAHRLTGTGGAAAGGASAGQSGGSTGTGGVATGTGGVATGTGGAATGTGGAATSGSAGVSGGTGGGPGACGNGSLDPGESCDGSALQGASCAQLGYSGGTLACTSSCQFDVSNCAGGKISPSVAASRTTCAAPCSVFFDATATTGLSGSDYVDANWTWDFNDPTSPHKGTIGFLAAHVFDNPGTYHVTTRVQDSAGNAGSASTTITVSAMSGTTYYVASSGSDSNSGTSMTTPFRTFSHALGLAGTNRSILLRRGDTFNIGSLDITIGVPGPFLVGSYSDPAAPSAVNPILSSTDSASFSNVFILTGGSDMRFTDLHVVGGGAFQIFAITGAPTSLFERVEVEGYTQSAGGNGWGLGANQTNITVADSHAHNFNGYGVYADRSQNFALIGTKFDAFSGDHVFRLQGGSSNSNTLGQFTNNSYVAENSAEVPVGDNFSAGGLFRGEDKNFVYVNNTANRTVGIEPQNTSVIEHVSMGLVEGNTFARTDLDAGYTCLFVSAQHIVIRNNVCVNGDQFAEVQGYPLMPLNWVDQISISNNTYYFPEKVSYAAQISQIRNTSGTVRFKNNIEDVGSTSTASGIYYSDGSGTVVSDHNDLFAPAGGKLTAPNVGTGGILTDPQFMSTTVGASNAFRLASGSPAVGMGAPTN